MILKNLRATEEFRHLAAVLAEKAVNREVLFVPSPGNWGDGLINQGSMQFFRSMGIEVEEIRRTDLISKLERSTNEDAFGHYLIIVGGGGGWCSTWSSTKEFVEQIFDRVGHTVVLPTTFELGPVDDASDKITYFARDVSLSRKSNPDAIFCHDMAFYVDISFERAVDKLPRLVALRVDKEKSTDAVEFQFSVDLSLLGDAFSSVGELFAVIDRFERVVSDRLHLAIAGSMLGKDVVLLPGNYSKSRAVFEASIQDYYPKTKYNEWSEFAFWPVRPLAESETEP